MAKLNEQAAQELPLDGEFPAITGKAVNRHVAIALNHLNKRRDVLLAKIRVFEKEMEEIDQAITALE